MIKLFLTLIIGTVYAQNFGYQAPINYEQAYRHEKSDLTSMAGHYGLDLQIGNNFFEAKTITKFGAGPSLTIFESTNLKVTKTGSDKYNISSDKPLKVSWAFGVFQSEFKEMDLRYSMNRNQLEIEDTDLEDKRFHEGLYDMFCNGQVLDVGF